jgi:peptidoglycan/xylan/chitin deacetylase (PgdA/CDA1 family)
VAFRVALTFDAEHPDRPGAAGAGMVLDALAAAGVRATFFIQGRWAEAEPVLARRIRDSGHLIGSHSHYHARMPLFSAGGFRTDVRAAQGVIRRKAAMDPRPWFRLPFGAGAERAELIDALAKLGYRHVGWDVEPREWRTAATAAGVAKDVVDDTLARGDGAIVLMHTWPRPTAIALPRIISTLRQHGAHFVRVDELPLPPGLSPIAHPRPAVAASVDA